MRAVTPRQLKKVIAAHPVTSLQDGLLIFSVMIVAVLLALQFDLFFFIDSLSSAERRISLGEAIFLTLLLAASLFVFIIRRMSDQRHDVALKMVAEIELNELKALAMQDPLTGLLNRRALMTALTVTAKSPPTGDANDALFMIDLSNFKSVNDRHGHAVGDHVLEVVASRFQSAARPNDVVARIGGDEFAVIAYNVDRDAAHKVCSRLVECLKGDIRAGGHTHKVSMAVGIALLPDDATTVEEALRFADLAMYRAKKLDRPMMFFEPAMAQKQIG